MMAIFKREFKSHFISMIGFLFAAVLLVFVGVFATQFHILGKYAKFEYTLQSACTVLLLIVPLLTMRSLTEDKRSGADRLMYSLPLKLFQIILGKYLAMLATFALPTLIVAVYPLVFSAFGEVNLVSAYAALLAFFLLGAALIAVCLFLSTLADSQVIAAILGFGAVFLLYIVRSISTMIPISATVSAVCFGVIGALIAFTAYSLTHSPVVAVCTGAICICPVAIAFLINKSIFEGLFPSLLSKLALFNRFEIFVYGIFDISTIILYLSFAVFFVVLTILAANKKRWN